MRQEAGIESGTSGLYAGFGSRLLAWGIDSMFVSILSFTLGLAVGLVLSVSGVPQAKLSRALPVLGWVISLSLGVFYYVVIQALCSATLGKAILGLRVVREKDLGPVSIAQALGRYAMYFVSWFAGGLGFLAIFWNAQRQGWHDRASGVVVVHRDAMTASLKQTTPAEAELPSFKKAA